MRVGDVQGRKDAGNWDSVLASRLRVLRVDGPNPYPSSKGQFRKQAILEPETKGKQIYTHFT